MTKYVDAHIHLSDTAYNGKVSYVVEEAKRVNVVALVSNSMDLETCARNIQLAQDYNGLVYIALGIHPWNVTNLTEEELERTLDFILHQGKNNPKVVAIGEVGLDPQYAKRKQVKDLQLKVFQDMLHAAENLSLPVIVHSRWSAPKIMPIFPSYKLKGVLFHWFSSPVELLPQINERGYCVSEGPPTVFSARTQDVVKHVPITNLLTETDGPVQFYGPFEDKLTTPAFIPQVVKAIAQVKQMKEEDVAEQVLKNFANFFEINLGAG